MSQAEQLTSLEHVGLARLEGLVVADAGDEDAAPALVSELCLVSCHLHAAAACCSHRIGFVLDRSLKLGMAMLRRAATGTRVPAAPALSPWTHPHAEKGFPNPLTRRSFVHANAKPAPGSLLLWGF